MGHRAKGGRVEVVANVPADDRRMRLPLVDEVVGAVRRPRDLADHRQAADGGGIEKRDHVGARIDGGMHQVEARVGDVFEVADGLLSHAVADPRHVVHADGEPRRAVLQDAAIAVYRRGGGVRTAWHQHAASGEGDENEGGRQVARRFGTQGSGTWEGEGRHDRSIDDTAMGFGQGQDSAPSPAGRSGRHPFRRASGFPANPATDLRLRRAIGD